MNIKLLLASIITVGLNLSSSVVYAQQFNGAVSNPFSLCESAKPCKKCQPMRSYWEQLCSNKNTQTNQNYTQPNQNYTQPNQNYTQPNQNYTQPSQNYPQPSQNYPQPSQNYPQPSQNYPQPSQNYPQPSQNYEVADQQNSGISTPDVPNERGIIRNMSDAQIRNEIDKLTVLFNTSGAIGTEAQQVLIQCVGNNGAVQLGFCGPELEDYNTKREATLEIRKSIEMLEALLK